MAIIKPVRLSVGNTSIRSIVFLSLIFNLSPAFAESTADRIAKTGAEVDEVLEEITIVGDRSMGSLTHLIMKAEDRIYDIFNSMNDDKRYDVACRWEAPINSHIKRRSCRPNFVLNAQSDNARTVHAYMEGSPYATDPSGASYFAVQLYHHFPIFHQKMVASINENPELLEAIVKYNQLKGVVYKEKARRYGDTNVTAPEVDLKDFIQ
ncbi:MAG: hypothetical protein EPO31_03810 [Gammaproteobacteria bacterium]|jgi:hypothetical protein|nr:MAG: hypothetical protein EPO31_03810 [Gammaproteobacteria bacterium]